MVNAGPTSFVAFSAGEVVSIGCTIADSEGAWVGAAVSCAFVVSPGPAQGLWQVPESLPAGSGTVPGSAVLPLLAVQVLLCHPFLKPWKTGHFPFLPGYNR